MTTAYSCDNVVINECLCNNVVMTTVFSCNNWVVTVEYSFNNVGKTTEYLCGNGYRVPM